MSPLLKSLLLAIIWVISLSALSVAQNPATTDSLKQALLRAREDTSRINILNQLSYQYVYYDLNVSSQYAKEALQLSQKLNYVAGMAEAFSRFAWVQSMQGRHQLSLQYNQRSLRLFRSIHHQNGEVSVLNNMGAVYQSMGDFPSALRNYLAALHHAEHWPHVRRSLLAHCLHSIGNIYVDLKDYPKAIASYKRAIGIVKAFKDSTMVAIVYNSLGSAYMDIKKYPLALQYFQEALPISKLTHSKMTEAITQLNIGTVYLEQRQYNLSFVYLQEAVNMSKSLKYNRGVALSYLALAKLHYRQKQYGQAERYAYGSLRVSEQNQLLTNIQESYLVLADIFQAQKNFAQALDSYKKGKAIGDSIFSAQNNQRVSNLQNQYENARKEQQYQQQRHYLERLEKDRKIKSLSVFIVVILLLCLAGFSWFFVRQQRLIFERNKAELEAQRATSEARQLAAQSKINVLHNQIIVKNKELTSLSLHLSQKGELLCSIKEHVEEISPQLNSESVKQLQKLKQYINSNTQTEREWEQFKLIFEQVHQDFFRTLQQNYLQITPHELKLAALLKLNFTSREIALFLSISEDSVKKARYRLRQKLQLPAGANLVDFIMRLTDSPDVSVAEKDDLR